MEKSKHFAGYAAAFLAAVGSIAYIANPEATEHAASKSIAAVSEQLSTADTTPLTAPTTKAPEQVPACKDITKVDIHTKVGALVIPMASITELDALEATLVRNQVSSFALLGILEDQVGYHGKVVPIAEATNGIIQSIFAKYGVKITFALDEEGGKVQRTKKLDGGAHALKSPQEQSAWGPQEITAKFKAHGEYLTTLGVNTVFGPLTDVGTHGADGSRSYSDDPLVMAESAGAAIEGLRQAGISATAKHLPDNGRDLVNTDDKPGVVPDVNILRTTTFPAIKSVLVDNRPTYGMVGNYIVPGLTLPNQPASMSPPVYALIRSELGFTGAFMTDALNAKSILAYTNAPSLIESQVMATTEAIVANADIAIISLDATDAVVAGIYTALATGTISQTRIDDAATHALRAKGDNIC